MIAMIIRVAYDGPPYSYEPKEQPMLGCGSCNKPLGLVREGLRGLGRSAPPVVNPGDGGFDPVRDDPAVKDYYEQQTAAASASIAAGSMPIHMMQKVQPVVKYWPYIFAAGAIGLYFIVRKK
jgi:hypothetical protein